MVPMPCLTVPVRNVAVQVRRPATPLRSVASLRCGAATQPSRLATPLSAIATHGSESAGPSTVGYSLSPRCGLLIRAIRVRSFAPWRLDVKTRSRVWRGSRFIRRVAESVLIRAIRVKIFLGASIQRLPVAFDADGQHHRLAFNQTAECFLPPTFCRVACHRAAG